MTEFPTLERSADEHQRETTKEHRRRKLGQVVGVVFFLLCVLEVILLGPRSLRTQKQVERDLAELQLPAQAVQEGYKSDRGSRKGYAERLFVSTMPPQDVCGFYKAKLQDGGWSLERENCQPIDGPTSVPSDRVLLEFGKARTVCRLFYIGLAGAESKYSLRMEWLN